MTSQLSTVEIPPQSSPAKASIIWMHGLGANAHDFEPIVPYLQLPAELGVRFIFPNAPVRTVTINNGMQMQAWYDILSLEIPRQEDELGIRDADIAIQKLIVHEQQRGIATENIILAGFSQGGAMALHTGLRYPERLAGILALSCYLPLASTVADERHPANQNTPVFIAHGRQDPVVPLASGQRSAQSLQQLGYTVHWQEYDMAHEVNIDEIRAIGHWLTTLLSA